MSSLQYSPEEEDGNRPVERYVSEPETICANCAHCRITHSSNIVPAELYYDCGASSKNVIQLTDIVTGHKKPAEPYPKCIAVNDGKCDAYSEGTPRRFNSLGKEIK